MDKSLRKPATDRHQVGEIYGSIAIPHIQDVDDAAYRIAHTFPGRVPALAQRMGMPASTLNKKVSLNCETHNLTLDEATQMQACADKYDVLYAMGWSLGHVCLPMPDMDCGQVSAQLAKVGAEVGDVFRVAQQALDDGNVTPNERRVISEQVAEAITALAALLKVL
ncbi:MAG: hypothetical protein EPO09_04955 [Aquabacterium sp.]|uniref:phage regulatory CII family protein n=1 Tax=Aquabacterium sp. TaxID=1872578 RepID=UPI0011F74CD9|nr:phage regulatory CII family protein [Aquabacterium sp.]TAK97060.1 MAG: hypothetical protein EPO09_04955 [Aquabacterium sp.]